MNRPLNSDELGAKGEQKFGELCLDARLKPNQSDRDRVGWDYVVTWPLLEAAPLDCRPAPLACHVQVKTVWQGNGSISLNIGTFEHIVKDARPAFIVIFEVEDQSLAFVGARIIHIADDFLSEILKRLRQAQVDGKAPNKISFTVKTTKWGIDLPAVTGAALKAAFEEAMPEGMASYGREKNRQLAQLGFEKGFMTLETSVQASSADEIIDGFLGLTSLPVIDAKHFLTRFGIPVEVPVPWDDGLETVDASLTMKMGRTEACTVTVTRAGDGAVTTFTGDLYVVPAAISGEGRMILEARSKLLRIRLDLSLRSGSHGSSVIFAGLPDLETISARASDWATYYRIAGWAVSEPLTVQIKGRRINTPPAITGELSPCPDHEEAHKADNAAKSAEIVEWAMLKAQAPGTKLTSRQLFDAAPGLAVLRAMEQSPQTVSPLSFTTIGGEKSNLQPDYEMLYLNSVPVGEHEIAYAARVRMRTSEAGDVISWVSDHPRLAHVRKIKPREKALRKFAREARRITGITSWFGPGELGD
ncbi:hypothetical protein SAMN05518849_11834 [Sphingobium sp. AP50]|uniref:hypothetical protein n=1 Tax=Sphingobium sp. AP50 TaxID=1884369 RepID=UPI0008B40CB7|nr:hypothetical protein [Sphingobium sp. AP50]SEJ91696.1 hypothetical protein SAMN05518849_11834 [Sphingobium sp. AP50]